MTGVIVNQKIFDIMINDYVPNIGKKFKEIEFDTSIFAIPWFVCLFSASKIDQKVYFIVFYHHYFKDIRGDLGLFIHRRSSGSIKSRARSFTNDRRKDFENEKFWLINQNLN